MRGYENRDLSMKDRISLLSRTQVMKINGESEAKIEKFANDFSQIHSKSLVNIGGEFSQLMGTLGYLTALISLVVHYG